MEKSSSSASDSDSSGSVIRYSSHFMRTLRSSDAAKDVPSDILRRYQQAEFYNAKQQFDPDQIATSGTRLGRDTVGKSSEPGLKAHFAGGKDDATLQPQLQLRRAWTQGCGANMQSDPDSQAAAVQSGSVGLSSTSKLQQSNVTNNQINAAISTTARQPGIFASANRPPSGALPLQTGSLRAGSRSGADFGHGYANTYRPARDAQDFRQSRPPFGRGRGLGGRGQEEYEAQAHGSHRFPPPLFQQQRQNHFGAGFGGRGGAFSSRRHTQSTGDSVPEWFIEGPSDPSMMMELGGELPSSSRSSTPAESSGDESCEETKMHDRSAKLAEHPMNNAVPGVTHIDKEHSKSVSTAVLDAVQIESQTKQLIWEGGAEKERPASQQLDYTYLLWSSLHSDFGVAPNEPKTGSCNDQSQPAAEITGSRLWSVWKDSTPLMESHSSQGNVTASSSTYSSEEIRKSIPQIQQLQMPAVTEKSQNFAQQMPPTVTNLRDWLENAQQPQRSNQSQPTVTSDSNVLHVTTADTRGNSATSASPAPRGLNPNDLFAKFSSQNGGNTSVPTTVASNASTVSPPIMSVEDLERKLMMKKQGSSRSQLASSNERSIESERELNQSQRQASTLPQQRPSHEGLISGQLSGKHPIVDDANCQAPAVGLNTTTLQMQLAAAHQAMLNAAAAAANSVSGGPGNAAAVQQQKMLFANLLQQQNQHFAPYLAAAAAAAAAASSHNTTAAPSTTGSSSGSATSAGSGPPPVHPFFGMYPPSAIAAAAAAAAAQSASSPLFYYPQILQQAQAHAAAAAARLPGSNSAPPLTQAGGTPPVSSATTGNSSIPGRPQFPIPPPPPGAFPNFPTNFLNPTAAASLMAAALSHFQQQQQLQQQQLPSGYGKSSSPGPLPGHTSATPNNLATAASTQSQSTVPLPSFNNGTSSAAAAAAAAATALMANRIGLPSHMTFHPAQQQGTTGLPSAASLTHVTGGTSQLAHSVSGNAVPMLQQSQAQTHAPINSPPQGHTSPLSAASNSSSKLNASFIPTQVMMKNPQAALSPDTSSSTAKTTASSLRTNAQMNKVGSTKQIQATENLNPPLSYSSVAAVGTISQTASNGSNNLGHSSNKPNTWNAEDLERPFMKSATLRDSSSSTTNYASYPPLNQQGMSGQRTAGIAAANAVAAGSNSTASHSTTIVNRFADQSHRLVETAHQFSVADLLRGAANATSKAAQSSSAGYN